MAAIIIAFILCVVVGVALYFSNVICSWGIGNDCPSPAQQPSTGTGCSGRIYRQCTRNSDCPNGKNCESITINFSQVMACI